MMETMRVIVANDAPIITIEHCHFDVYQVVPGNDIVSVDPNLASENSVSALDRDAICFIDDLPISHVK
jgi:hypothetical protein